MAHNNPLYDTVDKNKSERISTHKPEGHVFEDFMAWGIYQVILDMIEDLFNFLRKQMANYQLLERFEELLGHLLLLLKKLNFSV